MLCRCDQIRAAIFGGGGRRLQRPTELMSLCAVRVWAVVTSVDPLRVWMFDGGLVIFRVQEDPSEDGMSEQPLGFNLWTQDRAKTVVWRCNVDPDTQMPDCR